MARSPCPCSTVASVSKSRVRSSAGSRFHALRTPGGRVLRRRDLTDVPGLPQIHTHKAAASQGPLLSWGAATAPDAAGSSLAVTALLAVRAASWRQRVSPERAQVPRSRTRRHTAWRASGPPIRSADPRPLSRTAHGAGMDSSAAAKATTRARIKSIVCADCTSDREKRVVGSRRSRASTTAACPGALAAAATSTARSGRVCSSLGRGRCVDIGSAVVDWREAPRPARGLCAQRVPGD